MAPPSVIRIDQSSLIQRDNFSSPASPWKRRGYWASGRGEGGGQEGQTNEGERLCEQQANFGEGGERSCAVCVDGEEGGGIIRI